MSTNVLSWWQLASAECWMSKDLPKSTNVRIVWTSLLAELKRDQMAKKTAPLSKGEMVVASALWRLETATLGELHEEVSQSDSMEYATVQSYIRRLETKGYVKAKRVGRNNVYSPKIKPEKVIGQTLDQMMKQLFDGKAIPLFRHLIKDRGISDSELAELRAMIESAEGSDADDADE